MTLEEEYKALLSDKDGETEYLCSLQDQVEQIKVDTFFRLCLLFHEMAFGCGAKLHLSKGGPNLDG